MTSLAQLASKCVGRRIAVIGDVMLDHFLYGRVDRISPEAPVPVVRFDRDEYRLGGAANVARNVAALGGRVSLVGLIGDDEAGVRLMNELAAAGIDGRGLVRDPDRATTRKLRVVTSRNQQVARIDYEHDAEAGGAVLDALRRQIAAAAEGAEAVVLSDYRKGVVNPAVIGAAVDAARRAGLPLLADPKVPQAERYRGATLVTPNHHEAELMTQTSIRTPGEARRAAEMIHERSGASVLVTWGELGMWLLDASRTPAVEEHLPAAAREVADVTGAGDTVIGVLAMGVASGARLIDAARLANLAAGLVVARFGPAAVSAAELSAAAEAASR
ncbi:MAG TPA: PfkB family carbohydrate kinase [Vicinamibacterales bacterium]|nr:PfkB family carbohydrate kinase [Vicinamibacterales bacterium]